MSFSPVNVYSLGAHALGMVNVWLEYMHKASSYNYGANFISVTGSSEAVVGSIYELKAAAAVELYSAIGFFLATK